MSDDSVIHSIQETWQAQTKEDEMIALADLQKKMGSFRKKILRRNWIEYGGVPVITIIFGGLALHYGGTLFVMGCAAIIAGVLIGVSYLRKHGSPLSIPQDATLVEYVRCHRAELTRQRDLLRSAPLWYVGPILPGMVLFLAGAQENGVIGANEPPVEARLVVVVVVFSVAIVWNLYKAHTFQKEIDALDQMVVS